MSTSNETTTLGSTVMVVGLSGAVQFVPPSYCNGGFFKIQSGAGSLAIASGFSQAYGSTMYHVGASEIVTFTGPAKFFLAASAATMIVSVGLKFSSGYSSPILG